MKHNAPRSSMKRKFTRKKGPVRANKVSYDGINFASGLEKYMYIALQKAKLTALYTKERPSSYNKALNFHLKVTSVQAIARENLLTEVTKKSLILNTLQTL
jgi:hypothetical protein